MFARVSPAHKIRLVQAYQAEGNVVAMTGDGVNDAPALKKADIGLAMGVTGTDVAKEAAQLVLLDDNFATIVAAVQEGRVVYDNVRRFIKYLLTSNASEVAVMLFGPLLGMPLPLLPLQILWMNLVTDGLPALALGVEPAEEDVMRRPPQAATASIFGRGMVAFIVVLGLAASLVSLAVGLFAFRAGDAHWQTLLFTTLIFSSLALAVGVRSETQPFWKRPLSNPALLGALVLTVALQLAAVYVPFLQRILGTTALPPPTCLAFAAGASVLLAVEAWKWALRRSSADRREYFNPLALHLDQNSSARSQPWGSSGSGRVRTPARVRTTQTRRQEARPRRGSGSDPGITGCNRAARTDRLAGSTEPARHRRSGCQARSRSS